MDDLELTPEPKKKAKKSKAEIELDKMLAEARAADEELAKKEANKPKVEPAKEEKQMPEQPKQIQENSDILKWFFLGLIVVSLIGGYFIYSHLNPSNNFVNPATGLAVYNPEKLLDGWTLDIARTNLAEMPANVRSELISQSVTNAATWEFSKGNEKLYFWTRIYGNNKSREKYDDAFTQGILWKMDTRSELAVGDKGYIGIYVSSGDNPLMTFIEQGNQIWYVSYHNNNGAYDPTNISDDKFFLVNIAKQFYNSFSNASS